MSELIGTDPLALMAIEAGMVRPPLADQAAEGTSQLDSPQRAAAIGEPVPIVFCRRDETAGTGGVLVSPPATEARFSNDASNNVTASYHLVLSEGRIGRIQVRDVFQRSCRVGTHTQTYNRRAGTWQPGNVITAQGAYPVPQASYHCGTVGTYLGMSTLSFTVTIPNGFDFWNRQVHAFIRNGMEVERLIDGVIGSSNNWADLYRWGLRYCSHLNDDQMDMGSLRAAAMFLQRNGFTCDMKITDSNNLNDLFARQAPYFLLTETRYNGRRGLRPLVVTNADGTIKVGPVTWRCQLTEDHIQPDGFELAHVPAVDRLPFCVQAIWRQQLTDDFGIIRTSEVRYQGEAIDGPFEQHDLSAFACREDHAVKAAAYIRARRAFVGHTARITLRQMELPAQLEAGDLFRVTLTRDAYGYVSGVHDLLYQVERVELVAGQAVIEATHFPVDSQGRSLVAMAVAGARGAGIMLSSNKSGIGCDINSSSDETIPAETYIEAGPIDEEIIQPKPATDSSGGNDYSYTVGYDSPPNDPPVETANGSLYIAETRWAGLTLEVVMRIDPPGRAPQDAYGDLFASIESGVTVEVDEDGVLVNPQPGSMPSLRGTGLVARPWSTDPDYATQPLPPPGRIFEGVFKFPYQLSDFPVTEGHQYLMPIEIKSTSGGFPEVPILNQAVATFGKRTASTYEYLYISIIDEDNGYDSVDRESDWTNFLSTAQPNWMFILLVPNTGFEYITLPNDYSGVKFLVTRPGDGQQRTDYASLLADYIGPMLQEVKICVDESGSMTRASIAADLDLFELYLTENSINWTETIMNPSENWIANHP